MTPEGDFRPVVAITMGDPAGVGPEIIAKALADESVYHIARPLVIGNVDVLKRVLQFAPRPLKLLPISRAREAKFEPGTVDVYEIDGLDVEKISFGQVSAIAGRASGEYIKKSVELAQSGQIDAVVTAPINKESLNLGGFHYSGHTEFYADLTGARSYAMMLLCGSCRVVHVSTHVSLRQACELVRRERILEVIKLAHAACVDLGVTEPRIAVASLNPHSGEGGLFGREEIDQIIPAIDDARKLGLRVEGPVPSDTLFARAFAGGYDIVVAMYHDQGHIPTKLMGLRWDESQRRWVQIRGVNVTLGLPIVRVSVDHGTAFDIAGKGVAMPDSLIEAIEIAAVMARSRRSR